MTFPVYLRIGTFQAHPHAVFESLAYVVAFAAYFWLRRRSEDPISLNERWWVIAGAMAGATVGSTLLAYAGAPFNSLEPPGKTIVGGLVGGWIAIEWIKKIRRISTRTGDLFALPLALGIAVGRIGCFLTGLSDQTYGYATRLPWGIDFGDGIHRHPTQLYEIAFLVGLAVLLRQFMARAHLNGDIFKAFMIGYMGWRLAIDFLKPGLRAVGLTAIQWTCLVVLLYCARDLVRMIAGLRADSTLVHS